MEQPIRTTIDKRYRLTRDSDGDYVIQLIQGIYWQTFYTNSNGDEAVEFFFALERVTQIQKEGG